MTACKSRCCASRLRLPDAAAALGLGLVLLLCCTPPVAAQALPAVSGAADRQELYLAVTVNGEALSQLARFLVGPGDAIAASAATLREIGLRWPGSETATGLVELAQLTGLQARYDRGNQQIILLAPVAMLDRVPLRLVSGLGASRPAELSPPVPGLLFNYDLFAQDSRGVSALNGWSELRMFGLGPGVWSSSMNTGTSRDALGVHHSSVRLDTAWQVNWPQQALSLTLGDTFTGALAWSRAVRVGGLRVGRNFALQPYQVTAPLNTFVGEATLPSTVDLYINGLRQSSQRVAPGQFLIDSLPSLNGAGRAQLVITDINGQRRNLDFDFYGAPSLLREGLWDWSVTSGFVRQDYGLASFSYDRALVASGSARYGLSDRSTLEAQAQAGGGVALAGGGGSWRLGEKAGVLSASLAASHGGEGSGRQLAFGYQWMAQPYSVSVNSQRRSLGWRDIASRFETRHALDQDSAYAGFSSLLGQFGVIYVRQSYDSGDSQRFLTLSWSRQFGDATLSLNLLKDLGMGGDYQAQLALYLPLDRRRSLAVTAARQEGRTNLAVDASQSVDSSAGGWGWRVQAAAGNGAARSQAEVTQMGDLGQWRAGLSGGSVDATAAYAGANGAAVWMGGGIKPMRRVDDAFALVSTSGVPDVPVRLENRLVGRTDGEGLLLIPQLNAYQRNQVAIDTLDLPPDMRVESTTANAVPESRSGTLVAFKLRRVAAVQLSLRDAAGTPLPVGSTVTLQPPGAAGPAATTSVGYDGLVYLEDPPAGLALRVDREGGACTAPLPPVPGTGWIDLGPVTCR